MFEVREPFGGANWIGVVLLPNIGETSVTLKLGSVLASGVACSTRYFSAARSYCFRMSSSCFLFST